MPLYVFEAKDGAVIEEFFPMAAVPKRIKKEGKVYRRVVAIAAKKMQPETTSPLYQEWFHSEPVQAKLRSGEYYITPKSHNINHL